MGRFVGGTWQTVGSSPQIVIYGLSLSPLDAEFAFAIGVGLRGRSGQTVHVHIFDLEHQVGRVERRVRMLTRNKVDLKIHRRPISVTKSKR